MQTFLEDLARLDSKALHVRAAAAARQHATATWELAACLLAMDKSKGFRAFDCASTVEYAERKLHLGVVASTRLLRIAGVLERFPKLSEACRVGRLCWSKLREVARVVDESTEEAWLAFVLAHTSREVERAVAVSSRQFHREKAMQSHDEQPSPNGNVNAGRPVACGAAAATPVASRIEATPAATSAEPAGCSQPGSRGAERTAAEQSTATCGVEVSTDAAATCIAPTPASPSTASTQSTARGSGQTSANAGAQSTPTAGAPSPPPAPKPPAAPMPPRLVKVELWMTPDQFAIWDESLERVRSQKKRRVSREAALEALARHYLASGDARTKVNHPVVVRVDSADGIAYYETSRGVLPASAAAVEDALARERGSYAGVCDVEAESKETSAAREAQEPTAAHETQAVVATRESELCEAHGSRKSASEIVERPLPDRDFPAAGCDVSLGRDAADTDRSASASALGDGATAHNAARSARSPRGRRAMPLAIRREALARASFRCQRCGATSGLEVDHVDPLCDGGSHRLNTQVLCRRCHALKHADDFANDPRYVRGRAAGLARGRRRREEKRSTATS